MSRLIAPPSPLHVITGCKRHSILNMCAYPVERERNKNYIPISVAATHTSIKT